MKKIVMFFVLASLIQPTCAQDMPVNLQSGNAIVIAIENSHMANLQLGLETEQRERVLTKEALESYLYLAQTKLQSLRDRITKKKHQINKSLNVLLGSGAIFFPSILGTKAKGKLGEVATITMGGSLVIIMSSALIIETLQLHKRYLKRKAAHAFQIVTHLNKLLQNMQ